ncbi:type I restriction enzyme, S subunit [Candidatus Methanophagaceae archaeon]|nr:type I restriction enzyme, S subunit [Methanophagales archaeon]
MSDVPEGYKMSEVGVIPEGWEVKTIQELIDNKDILDHLDGNHGELYPRSEEFKESGVPYVGANDFSEGHISFQKCKYLSKERAKQFRKGVAKNGDVLFAHNATVGPVALLKTKFDFVILSTTATYFRCNEKKFCNIFLQYALQAPFFIKQYQAVMAQSTRFQVPITAQRKFSLVFPPIPEQQAIASALSDVDALITALEQLITKKRNVKQGAMQQLLTGKKRLPGFGGAWEVKKLGEIADIISGGTPSTIISEFWNGDIKWCTPTDITRTKQKYLLHTEKNISEKGLKNSSATLLPVGALLLCSRATIGEIRIAKDVVCTNQGFKSLVCKKSFDNQFVYYLLLQSKQKLIDKAIGSTFLEISKKDTDAIELTFPPFPEQKAIAQILSDMDTEIEALEQKQAKYKAIKQGMMQELLTGKRRLA